MCMRSTGMALKGGLAMTLNPLQVCVCVCVRILESFF
jgi:hypothetical protein